MYSTTYSKLLHELMILKLPLLHVFSSYSSLSTLEVILTLLSSEEMTKI